MVRTPSVARQAHWSSTDALMILVVVIWGINFTLVKLALRSFSPLSFNALRFTLATLAMLGVVWMRRESLRPAARDLLGIVLLGVVGHALYQWFFINGLAHTTPGNTSLLMGTSPVFVAIYGHLLGIERGNRTVWAGIILSFMGMVLLILGGSGGLDFNIGTVRGDLLVLVAAMFWAAYTTGSKPFLARYTPIQLTLLSMLAGTPPLVLGSLGELSRQDWAAIPPGAWAILVYSAIMAIVVSYTLWNTSLQRVGNARTAIYSNVTPVVAIIFAWVLLGDRFTLLQTLGGAVVIGGLLVTRRGRIH